ncbi:hypothetical protein [Flavobacterium hydatis]|uniref:Uncharacterized protein n=1 Tax=Flavobacterium hydatis TaxID=991 RepID=A0A086A0Y0_FLAHY|nr:hypothetical protein [Flavobacterium hydatis]KFF10344.1 hypothetical protein IW20_20965 [Flavobacterium hydatis]OXA92667.1 hypothetical protein B0A62_14800 [Flavobacterium hydatis]
MKKKIYITLATLILLFLAYYYWENRYVELQPVIAAEGEYTRRITFFDNDLYKFAKPNEISPSYYKNIEWVLDDSRIDYIEENGIIYVRNKFLNDMNMVWNYTTRAISTKYFKQERESDSLYLIRIRNRTDFRRNKIDSILKTIKTDSIKFLRNQGNKEN